MTESLIDRALGLAPGPVEGTLRMAGAVGADVLESVLALSPDHDDYPDDPFAARDPEYIRRTLPALQTLSRGYFRGEVRGLENIPKTKPVLLVGNHSGGTLIADTFVFSEAFYRHFGPERRFHQLAHDLVFKLPGLRAMLSRYGTVPASPENMRRALEQRSALLVYPGGDHETYRPSWESSRIDSAGALALASWRSRPTRRSSPWWRSAARRPPSSSVAAGASPRDYSSTGCFASRSCPRRSVHRGGSPCLTSPAAFRFRPRSPCGCCRR